MEALEYARQRIGGYAHARVAHGETERVARIVQAHLDRALERVLECVRDQIEHDLLPHLVIDERRLRERRTIDTSERPAWSHADRKLLTTSAVSAARSTGW
jgi:hypothetical protein